MVRLVNPSTDYEHEYLAFYEDWLRSGEKMIPWVIQNQPSDFPGMVALLYAEDSEEKLMDTEADKRWVPHSTYWLLNDKGVLVGALNIRHRLNMRLLNNGGHIGFGIRPSQRRKGYAKELLALALKQTDRLGIRRVLIVCDRGNIGSEKTILSQGGEFESEFTEENGKVVRRFWISREQVGKREKGLPTGQT